MAYPAPCWCHAQRRMSTNFKMYLHLLPGTKIKKCRFIHSSFGRISSFHSPVALPSTSLPRAVSLPASPPSSLPPWKCWSLMIQPNNRRHVPGSRVASRDPRPPPPFLCPPLPSSSCVPSLLSPSLASRLSPPLTRVICCVTT